MSATQISILRRVTFHQRTVEEGETVYLQPGEEVRSITHDGLMGAHHITIMCVLYGPPDGGTPAHIDGPGVIAVQQIGKEDNVCG